MRTSDTQDTFDRNRTKSLQPQLTVFLETLIALVFLTFSLNVVAPIVLSLSFRILHTVGQCHANHACSPHWLDRLDEARASISGGKTRLLLLLLPQMSHSVDSLDEARALISGGKNTSTAALVAPDVTLSW